MRWKRIHALSEFARLLCTCNPLHRFSGKRDVLHSLEMLLREVLSPAENRELANCGNVPEYLEEHIQRDYSWIAQNQTVKVVGLRDLSIFILRNSLSPPISRNIDKVLKDLPEQQKALLRTQILLEDVLGQSDMEAFYEMLNGNCKPSYWKVTW